MTPTELLESVRRVEVRTNRLVNDVMVGAYLSHFKGRSLDFDRLEFAAECRSSTDSELLEFEKFGNRDEFAKIAPWAGEPCRSSNSHEFDGIRIAGGRGLLHRNA